MPSRLPDPAALDKLIIPESVEGWNFLSHEKFRVEFTPGEALLICGENGFGKTNILEAPLFAMAGKVSKGLKMASLVRQQAPRMAG